MIKQISISFVGILFSLCTLAQAPKQASSADILQGLKKLEVFGSVLYVAAHPDDENTRFLGFMANEKKYRTGYLSLTRGDGGQNLIGDEQGINLGLIRTQELLSARRIDGAQQFFTRAYDFGFCKNPEEAMKIWDHDIVLADVVWVIRKFRPDVVIARFPTTGEGGHGHHTASGILAGEAFEAAADSIKFPEQLKFVKTWQAKRLLWNSFNFGGNNTTRDDHFKMDCGVYNSVLGKSYGEIAAESRSRHKSQGFGVPAQRGKNIEYFKLLKGDSFNNSFMEAVDSTKLKTAIATEYFAMVKDIINKYQYDNPKAIVKPLMALYNATYEMPFVTEEKRNDIQNLIKDCAGLFFEATAANQLNAVGDSMKVKFTLINRSGLNVTDAKIYWNDKTFIMDKIAVNENKEINATEFLPKYTNTTQPYFLEYAKNMGYYKAKQEDIGAPEIFKENATFEIKIEGDYFKFTTPVVYKYTDPVKAELYQPIQITHPAFVNITPNLLVFSNNKKDEKKTVNITVQSNLAINEKIKVETFSLNNNKFTTIVDSLVAFNKAEKKSFKTVINGSSFENDAITSIGASLLAPSFGLGAVQNSSLNKISYDHIPDIFYNYVDNVKVLKLDLKTAGTKAGYIAGAGDKVPQALEQMGYTVTMLTEKDITAENIKNLDVIIAGVRAYNVHDWLANVYPTLMQFVKNGGTYVVQYNTNNSLSSIKSSMAPYNFNISRNRITDETAAVNFLLPKDPVLNFPNKIVAKDFDGWIQERSIYNADKIDTTYRRIFSMKDPGEQEQDGSLIVADYGKGRFVYTGLVFFRELPAAVPGAYRLFANLIAKRR
jgi:LmbE family N-acetylglucosaminyl deacetylase